MTLYQSEDRHGRELTSILEGGDWWIYYGV